MPKKNSSFPVENAKVVLEINPEIHPEITPKCLPPVTCPCPGCCKASDYAQHGIGRNRPLGRPWQGSLGWFQGKKKRKQWVFRP